MSNRLTFQGSFSTVSTATVARVGSTNHFHHFFEIYKITCLCTFGIRFFFSLSLSLSFFFSRAHARMTPEKRKRSDRMSAKTRKVYILYQYYLWDRTEKRKGTPENGRQIPTKFHQNLAEK